MPKVDTIKILQEYNIHYQNFIPPQSAYFSVKRNGIIWHVFDAKRIPLGRMAGRAASYLTGKYKPIYDPKKVLEIGDRIIVVNGNDIKVTGKQRYSKIFRHHTGYAGGLHEILFIDLMRKDPQQLIRRVIKGMLPPNRTRKFLMERIKVYPGQYHPHSAMNIPQFMNQPKPDPNEILGIPKSMEDVKKGYTITYEEFSNTGESLAPEEFKDVPRNIDPMADYPKAQYSLDFMKDPRNRDIEKRFRDYKRKLKRYKQYK